MIHKLDDSQPHAFWDNALPPRLRIQPGDTAVFETLDGSGGQITPTSTAADIASLDRSRIHALSGPIFIEEAEPGDALTVEVLGLEHKGWGWSCISPAFGLLAGEFSDYALHHFRLEEQWCWFRDDIRIPYEPFCGVMGVAPREPGRLLTGPPGKHGGNVDIRHLTPGSVAIFPVWVQGALFSCGDCHAAQGDGEVNGTAIESPMTVTLRFNLQKRRNLPELQFTTPKGKSLTRADYCGYHVTTAHGPNLYANAQQAVRYMLDYLVNEHDLSREEAYILCGSAVDLKISEIVDVPNFVVSAYLPQNIFVSQ